MTPGGLLPSAFLRAISVSEQQIAAIREKRDHFYKSFTLELNGKRRQITPPHPFVMSVQRRLLRLLESLVKFGKHVHGGISDRSCVSNAKPHLKRFLVGAFDISNFYPSTTRDMVRTALVEYGFPDATSAIVADIATLRDALPQGAPTSMFLGNLVCRRVDRQLLKLSRRHSLSFTRYVDDLTLSGDFDFRSLQPTIISHIRNAGYDVNAKKLEHAWMFSHQRQIVTGIQVNRILRATTPFVLETKRLIRLCWEKAEFQTLADCLGLTRKQLYLSLRGRAEFIRGLDAKQGHEVKALLARIQTQVPVTTDSDPIITLAE